MRTEIRIGGFGGQGVILAGIILGKAASIFDKNEAVQTQSYGPEARGGASRTEVVVSDEEIDYPKVSHPDILVAMSHEALIKYMDDLKDEGVFVTRAIFKLNKDKKVHFGKFLRFQSKQYFGTV